MIDWAQLRIKTRLNCSVDQETLYEAHSTFFISKLYSFESMFISCSIVIYFKYLFHILSRMSYHRHILSLHARSGKLYQLGSIWLIIWNVWNLKKRNKKIFRELFMDWLSHIYMVVLHGGVGSRIYHVQLVTYIILLTAKGQKGWSLYISLEHAVDP